jgi:hypothetical protein
MYRNKITREEIEKQNERIKDFLKHMIKYTGWYREDENGDFVITDFGKQQSDNDDYIHGMGRPYEENGR